MNESVAIALRDEIGTEIPKSISVQVWALVNVSVNAPVYHAIKNGLRDQILAEALEQRWRE